MRLDGQEQSRNVEDRRGQRGPGAAALGGGGILVIIVMLVMKFMGASPEAQQMAAAMAKKVTTSDNTEDTISYEDDFGVVDASAVPASPSVV